MSKLTPRPDRMWTGVRWKNSASRCSAKWRGTTDAGLLRTGDNQTAGLAGMADGLGSLDILLQRWVTSGRYRYIPEYHCSTGSQKNAAGTENAGYSVSGSAADLPCVQHLSAIETTLQQCELWHRRSWTYCPGSFAMRLCVWNGGASGSGNHYHSP